MLCCSLKQKFDDLGHLFLNHGLHGIHGMNELRDACFAFVDFLWMLG